MRIQETRINEPTRQEVHTKRHRRLPVGAEVLPAGGVHFRVWASRCQRVEVLFEGGPEDTPPVRCPWLFLRPGHRGA